MGRTSIMSISPLNSFFSGGISEMPNFRYATAKERVKFGKERGVLAWQVGNLKLRCSFGAAHRKTEFPISDGKRTRQIWKMSCSGAAGRKFAIKTFFSRGPSGKPNFRSATAKERVKFGKETSCSGVAGREIEIEDVLFPWPTGKTEFPISDGKRTRHILWKRTSCSGVAGR